MITILTQCRKHLTDALRAAGIRSSVFTTMKALKAYNDSHVGAVLFAEESLRFIGSKRRYRDENGNGKKRTKMLERDVMFDVVIGEYTHEQAEVIYEAFLLEAAPGLYINGDFCRMEILEADWVEKDDSILKANIAVEVKIKFVGGVYRDTDLMPAKKIGLDLIVERVIPGKESTHGEKTGISGPRDGERGGTDDDSHPGRRGEG